MDPLTTPAEEKGVPILDALSSVMDWLWIIVVALAGFMFKKIFEHDTRLGEQNTQIALLKQQGDRFEVFCIRDAERREEQRKETLDTIMQQHEQILSAIRKIKSGAR